MNAHVSLAPVAQKPRIRFAYLMSLDGRCIATNHYGECGLNRHNQWAWIVGYMVNEFGCDPDNVYCIETDEGDRITVDGEPVAYLTEEA